MSLSVVRVTGTFIDPDEAPATGQVTFTLTTSLVNGTEVIEARPLTATLNHLGQLSYNGAVGVPLVANDDPGTTPPASGYFVTEQIDGRAVRNYRVTLSHTLPGLTVDLSALEPAIEG